MKNNLDSVKKIELGMLKKVIQICENNNLNYFVDSGTLLGTIRHKGFIPWDDDIDIVIPRSDFNKFIKIAAKEVEYPYFLQTGYSEKEYYTGIARIRRSDTTAILYKNIGKKFFNQGIFIDIFPLDGVIESKLLRKIQTKIIIFIRKILYIKIYYFKIGHKNLLKNILFFLLYPLLLLFPKKFLFGIIDIISRLGNLTNSKYVDYVLYRNSTKNPIPIKLNKEWFSSYIVKQFEGINVRIPKFYDNVLKLYYGDDYMVPKHTSTEHGEVFFDVNNSYIEYINGKRKIE